MKVKIRESNTGRIELSYKGKAFWMDRDVAYELRDDLIKALPVKPSEQPTLVTPCVFCDCSPFASHRPHCRLYVK